MYEYDNWRRMRMKNSRDRMHKMFQTALKHEKFLIIQVQMLINN